MGKVSKPKFLTTPQLTAGHNRHEAVLQQIRADLDDVTQTVIDHLRESKKDKLPLGGGEDYTSPHMGDTYEGSLCDKPRFAVGGLVRLRGVILRVDDLTIMGRYYLNDIWYYWVAGDKTKPATYLECQLESAE